MRDYRPALLAETGLIETAHELAVQERGGAQDLVHRDDTGAADAHHEDVGLGRDLGVRLGQGPVDLEDPALLLSWISERHHRQERRAITLQARVVLVAGRLMDLRLAPELGLDRMHRQAVALHTAVAASLADRLVDEDAHLGVGPPAALANAPLF